MRIPFKECEFGFLDNSWRVYKFLIFQMDHNSIAPKPQLWDESDRPEPFVECSDLICGWTEGGCSISSR